ncbi:hypothetical protein R3P38DRAFT_3339959 [Favolaschia claudopus]|uniref:F-box domain-containing protein n=1 Tax=Favolaschia claudopus TaxID=2862362 RepID=A0AAW0EH93_9AGAR
MTHSTLASLPPELLVAIAAAGQQERFLDLSNPHWQIEAQPGSFRSEWTMSHLSRPIRDTIVDASELWDLTEAELNAEGSIEILKFYLQRSKTRLIYATLRVSARPNVVDMDVLLERIGQIVPHIGRVRHLRIGLREDWTTDILFPLRELFLEHLAILQRGNSTWPLLVEHLFRKGAPRLTYLGIDGCKFRFPATPGLQWGSSLTVLELLSGTEAGDNDSGAAISASCHSLTHLNIDLTSGFNSHRFHVPSLQYLAIWISSEHLNEETHLLDVVDLFDTPGLIEWTIYGAHGDQISMLLDATSLPSALSFPSLKRLSFIRLDLCLCDISCDAMHEISRPPMSLFPALSSLTLINQCFTEMLLLNLFYPDPYSSPAITIFTGFFGMMGFGTCCWCRWRRSADGRPLPELKLFSSTTPSSLEDWQHTEL